MKIYVITSGEYSDYHICAVRESLDKAIKFKELKEKIGFFDEYYIEEYDTTNDEEWDYIYKYHVVLDANTGEKIYIQEGIKESYRLSCAKKGHFYICVYARNENHALKIARDKLAKEKWEKIESEVKQ